MTEEETTVDVVTTEEETTEATKVEIDKVADSKETTVDVETTEVVVIGTVQSVTTQTSHSEPNAIAVENLVALVVETTIDTAMTEEATTEATKVETVKAGALRETTVDGVETIVEAVVKHTMTMIGTVQSATTQTLHSEPNVIAVENPDQVAVAVDVALAETVEEDLLDAMTVHEHLDQRAATDRLAVKMVEGHLAVMVAIEETKAAMGIEVHTVKRDLNAGQGSLELLENLVVMAQAMHTTDHQSLLVSVEKTILEGQQWVPNITT